MPPLFSFLLQAAPGRLIALNGVDIAIIAIYFLLFRQAEPSAPPRAPSAEK